MNAHRNKRLGWRLVAAVVAMVGFGVTGLASAATQGFTIDKVLVNKAGGITASGTVDCSAAVLEMWGSFENVPANWSVVVNVDWTANQPVGRRMLTAQLQDSQASPCWANDDEFLDPGRCVEQSPGIWYPCRWDSSNWGDSGWIYGNGKFGTTLTSVDAVLIGGYWGDPDLGEYFGFWEHTTVMVKPKLVK